MITPALDRNGNQYGWYCHSGKHLWVTLENAEKCCDGIHVRVLQAIGPTFSHYIWMPREEAACH